jgi:hypothetical protein
MDSGESVSMTTGTTYWIFYDSDETGTLLLMKDTPL